MSYVCTYYIILVCYRCLGTYDRYADSNDIVMSLVGSVCNFVWSTVCM